MKRILVSLACLAGTVVVLVAGCDAKLDGADRGIGPQSNAKEFTVGVLGDRTRTDLLRGLSLASDSEVTETDTSLTLVVHGGGRTYRFNTAHVQSTAAHAAVAQGADLVLLAVNATDGPMPITREHILLARQMSVPDIAVVFTNSRLIGDPELLELEELELRELLNAYEMGGNDALCALDHPEATSSAGSNLPRGPSELLRSLSRVAGKRESAAPVWEGKRATASIYVLGRVEVFPAEVAMVVRTGKATLLMRGKSYPVELVVPKQVSPGDLGEIEVVFEEHILLEEAQRFALLHKGHIAAAGVFLVGGGR